MSVYDHIAWEDGSLFTIWGPCMNGTKLECDCKACQNANRIESEELDWRDEYDKARKRDFDRVVPNKI